MWNALRYNGILLVLVPVVTIALGLFLASMLNVAGRGRVGGVRESSIYKVVYVFPQVLSVAVVGVRWNEIYNPQPMVGW